MRKIQSRCFALEPLEHRLCLSASVGWDGPGLSDASLSYYIGTVPDGLDQPLVETTIEAALDVWSDVADIEFVETTRSGRPDSLDFRFTNIDGPGRTLARAYFPDDLNRNPVAGDVQFDAAENWEVGNGRGAAAFDLMLVAVHEIGHALGLDHSHAVDSVMRASVSASDFFTGLSDHDMVAVLSLYAPAETSPPPQNDPAATDSTVTLPRSDPDLPPGESATPTDTIPAPPADGADDPAVPDEPEDTDPDADDEPHDFTPNRFDHRSGWRHFPRFGMNVGPLFWPRFGRFPSTFVNRTGVTVVGRANDHDLEETASSAEPSEQADDGTSAGGREPASRREPGFRPHEAREEGPYQRLMLRRYPASSDDGPAVVSPMPSVVRESLSRRSRR